VLQLPGALPGGQGVTITGLAYEPAHPERVYAVFTGPFGSLRASVDSGATWTRYTQRDVGPLRDLLLTPDGQTLFAASDQGVWKFALQNGTPAPVSPTPTAAPATPTVLTDSTGTDTGDAPPDSGDSGSTSQP